MLAILYIAIVVIVVVIIIGLSSSKAGAIKNILSVGQKRAAALWGFVVDHLQHLCICDDQAQHNADEYA